MFKLIRKIATAALVITFAQAALAADYQITVQGQLAKDILAPSVFGIVDASVPVQISFTVNSANVVQINAGTTIISSSGASFSSAVQLVPRSSVSNFSATIGSVSFDSGDLLNGTLGNTSQSFDILLVGSLSENGISRVLLSLDDGVNGAINFGILNCLGNCSVSNSGDAVDYIASSTGELSGIQVATHVLTPPPSTKQLMKDLAADIKSAPKLNILSKLALDVILVAAAFEDSRNNLVKATTAMKAFNALLPPLVKCKQLTQAQADDFKAQALAIIESF